MALTKLLMPVWIFMLEAFGRDRDLQFSMFGCVTLTQTFYRDLTPKYIYKKHENEKRRQYAERVMEIERERSLPSFHDHTRTR